MARYATATGVTSAVTTDRGVVRRIPQDDGDMLGWRDLVEAVADVYQALPTQEEQRTVLYGANCGEAGALDLYGPSLDVEPEYLQDLCGTLNVTRFTQEWTVEENDVPIVVCREPNRTVQEVWEMNREAGARSETRGPET